MMPKYKSAALREGEIVSAARRKDVTERTENIYSALGVDGIRE